MKNMLLISIALTSLGLFSSSSQAAGFTPNKTVLVPKFNETICIPNKGCFEVGDPGGPGEVCCPFYASAPKIKPNGFIDFK